MITKQYNMKLQEELHVSKLSASNSAKNVILLNTSDKNNH